MFLNLKAHNSMEQRGKTSEITKRRQKLNGKENQIENYQPVIIPENVRTSMFTVYLLDNTTNWLQHHLKNP